MNNWLFVLIFIIGVFAGWMVNKGLISSKKKYDGTFLINTTSVKDEILSLSLDTDLDTLKKNGEMLIKVKVQ
jgi:hypothetical protein